MPSRRILWTIYVQCFFRDPARPLEWLNLLALLFYARFLFTVPDVFSRPAYSAFAGEPRAWGFLMLGVVVAQLLAMLPALRFAPTVRFTAMAVASGLWTILAVTFAQGDQISSVTGLYSAIAFVTAVTGIYLGLIDRPS